MASIFLLSSKDPKKGRAGSPGTPSPPTGPETLYVVSISAAIDTICGIYSPVRDPPRTARNGRCGSRSTVPHFRKVIYTQKVGSAGNDRPVIEYHDYMMANYQVSDFYGKEIQGRSALRQ